MYAFCPCELGSAVTKMVDGRTSLNDFEQLIIRPVVVIGIVLKYLLVMLMVMMMVVSRYKAGQVHQ